jgi:hypothetical protein
MSIAGCGPYITIFAYNPFGNGQTKNIKTDSLKKGKLSITINTQTCNSSILRTNVKILTALKVGGVLSQLGWALPH